ncbi:MAG: 2-iminoacetate synthase ThiH [Marinilabiliales bacterium]
MKFLEVLEKYQWSDIREAIYYTSRNRVISAIEKESRNLEDFMALISPAALPFLEEIAKISNRLTKKRFGNIIQLYIPLYLSNLCTNSCIYCGFNSHVKMHRIVLNDSQIMKEIEVIRNYGFKHILLVTGEDSKNVGFDYIKHAIELVKPYFSLISIEVQPLETDQYKQLIEEGLNTVYIYQETYNRQTYPKYHPQGKKKDFYYRLNTPERLGDAGIHKIGLGCLLGLEDWRVDSFFTALHLKFLQKKYWKTKFSISFPRLRPNQGHYEPDFPMTDKELVQLICAYRLLDEDVELSISVRESRKFRDNIVRLGITSMSAGSRTQPGGYSNDKKELEQFEVHDDRTPPEVVEMIKKQGYEPVWKDWDYYMQQ